MSAITRPQIKAELAKCRLDPSRYNRTILGRGDYWARQRELAGSVARFPVTLCPAGNMVGKSFFGAGLILEYLGMHPGGMVLATAPSQVQLEEVLWKQVEVAHRKARVPLGGRVLKDPLKIDLGGDWEALAYSTTSTERLSGHHRGDMLAVIDEGSGVPNPIFEAIDSCNPSRLYVPGNPLRPDGTFYERCAAAEAARDDPGRLANLIRISSLESPDIDLPRSPRGMADATWLAKARNDYGEGSIWWKSHVLAEFPDSGVDTVIPRDFLDRAGRAEHCPGGPRRLAIDLAIGNGGDRCVLLVRDDNGIVALQFSNRWDFAATATRAAAMVNTYRIEPRRVSWDVEGPGADFANRLAFEGVVGARPYRGGSGQDSVKYGNLRSAGAWSFRQRLDPARKSDRGGLWVPQEPFAIPPEFLKLMRPELQGLRYKLDDRGRVCLERKEDFSKRLRHSPDFADTAGQSFAFPNM